MKAFRFGDKLYAEYPYVGDNGYSLNVVGRVDNGDEPVLIPVNNVRNVTGVDPQAVVAQGESFTMQGVGYRCVTVEGFALGFDKL